MIMLDTHAWLWWVSDPARLGRNAAKAIEAASQIVIGAISCFEVATAVTKGRISLDRGPQDWLEQALALPRVELVGLTPAICVKATQLGREFPGDQGAGAASLGRAGSRLRLTLPSWSSQRTSGVTGNPRSHWSTT